MAQQTTRPEPGIATDKELETAADELWNAIEDTSAFTVKCERFDAVTGRGDNKTEVIKVILEQGGRHRKTEVINEALKSDASVKLRDICTESSIVTFNPTNQD